MSFSGVLLPLLTVDDLNFEIESQDMIWDSSLTDRLVRRTNMQRLSSSRAHDVEFALLVVVVCRLISRGQWIHRIVKRLDLFVVENDLVNGTEHPAQTYCEAFEASHVLYVDVPFENFRGVADKLKANVIPDCMAMRWIVDSL